MFFVLLKFYLKKNNKKVWNYPDNLKYYTTIIFNKPQEMFPSVTRVYSILLTTAATRAGV